MEARLKPASHFQLLLCRLSLSSQMTSELVEVVL